MKFQDDISNMNTYIRTYIHTYIRTSRNQYAPPLFQSWGHKNLVQIGTVASEKIRFEFLYVHKLGSRSRNDLDLQYSLTFINSLRCLLLLNFRSLAAIVSEKSTVFTFSHRKAYVTKFDLAVK